jgi:hypothetical protein
MFVLALSSGASINHKSALLPHATAPMSYTRSDVYSFVSAEPSYHPTPLEGPVYYVAPNGSSGNSGTHSSPWSLSHAVSMAQPGWTIVFKDGRYTSSSRVLDLRGKNGTASKPIRFVSENRWGAVLDGQLKSSTPDVVRFRDSSHLIVEGFTIRNGYLRGVRSDGPARHITLRQNRIHHNGKIDPCGISHGSAWGHGVLAGSGSFNWVIDSNLIHTNGRIPGSCTTSYGHDHGLYMKGDQHTIINNIMFDHIVGFNLKIDGTTEDHYSQSTDARSFVVMNNTFAHKPVQGQRYRNVVMFRNSGSLPRNVLVANNIFWGPTPSYTGEKEYAIHLSGSSWDLGSTELINNVTDAPHIIRPGYESGLLVNKGNVDNTTNPGIRGTTLGMVSPKSLGATEDDFRLTGNADLLIDRGAGSFPDQYGRGIPTEYSPLRDLVGTPRPQGRRTDIGAHERVQ